MPAGKAVALAAMPTAVLMGLGLTPTLASAKDNPTKFSVDDYKACADAVDSNKDDKGSDEAKDKAKESAKPTPTPSASASKDGSEEKKEKATPTPSPSASESKDSDDKSTEDSATPSPSASETKNPLDPLGVGDALKKLTSGDKESESATPSPSASESSGGLLGGTTDKVDDTVKDTTGSVKDTTDKLGDTVKDTTDKVKDTTDKVGDAAKDATKNVGNPQGSGNVPENCPAATDASGADEDTPAQLPDKSWKLQASSLLLKGADYKGLVDVRMADGSTKRVMKYVISKGTDIGDLHQIAPGPNGKFFHIRSDKGSTSTIRDGQTTMYTEEISGNLFGLVPLTFNAKNPPPLNLPTLFFTNVKVTQASQFGGTLHVPGLHTTIEDS
ncbi:hypothetical protein [Streptomyces endophyticus]|uniref:Hydrogenase expression protein HypF n=1 Tax=Streptomyces endophyticus TaxID=714166 RepID=A0ABU6F7K8_9ACTN|nr:hypothetical protein [Streptomyces endophyticus]MEB8338787.1 hypothetical protein [Streptomyces endophyticus]